MEDLKRNTATDVDKEIVFSKAIKAGKRIYYLDVKKNRKGEMFLDHNRKQESSVGRREVLLKSASRSIKYFYTRKTSRSS